MSSLFGVELPIAVNVVIAFVFVLLLIGIAAWLVRRFGSTRIADAARNRQPRLAVIDSANVDGRRKLVIIRRDNIEHLLMIGGPTDVVVETNIVRAAAAAGREAPTARNGGGNETLLRPMPIPDPTPWPLQPEPAPAPVAAPAPPPAPIIPAPIVRPERAPRIPEPRVSAEARAITTEETWQEPVETPVVHAPVVQPKPTVQAPQVRPVHRPADTLAGLAEELARPAPAVTHAEAPSAAPAPQAATASAHVIAPTDHSLAEMAQRLEAALRRPTAQKIVTEGNRVTTIVEVKAAPKAAAAAQPKARPQPAAQAQPQTQTPPPPSSLEQEMASLLSRPGKT